MPRKGDERYTITIRNWEKYQREMRGGEKRQRRRLWVAISVDLFSDPDYLALDSTHSRLWLGLLLHSGKVGPVFDMSPSTARHLFDLRRSCDFSTLKNHGFIDLQAATLHNSTGEDRESLVAATKDSARKPRAPRKAARGLKRCPADWMPSETLFKWAATECPDVDVKLETAMLKDCEFRVAHKDWQATWKNWMRREQKRHGKDRKLSAVEQVQRATGVTL